MNRCEQSSGHIKSSQLLDQAVMMRDQNPAF